MDGECEKFDSIKIRGMFMARLHSKKKGKAGTKMPKQKSVPEWVSVSKADLTALVVKMAKEGVPPSKIGLALRDLKGVPSIRAITGRRMCDLLSDEGVTSEYPEDLIALIKKAVKIRTHLKDSTADTHNAVKLSHVESKINRLVKYSSRTGRIPKNWRYSPEKAALLVK